MRLIQARWAVPEARPSHPTKSRPRRVLPEASDDDVEIDLRGEALPEEDLDEDDGESDGGRQEDEQARRGREGGGWRRHRVCSALRQGDRVN